MKGDKILDGYLDVYLSITGWTVAHRVLVQEEGSQEPYWDTQQTGIGKYKTREEAIVEAKQWSKSEGIKLREGL